MFLGHVIIAICLDIMDYNDNDNHYDHDNHNHDEDHENTDFDDFITEMFLGHVASLHSLGGDGFATQFEQVGDKNTMGEKINRNEEKEREKERCHQVSLGKDAVLASLLAGHPSNREKNRYNNVLPYDHTLVQLR